METKAILCLSRSATDRGSIASILGDRGFHVLPVASVAEAQLELQIRRVGLLVVDLEFGDAITMEFVARVRSSSDTPVVILTHPYDEDARASGARNGVADFVLKPFSPAELIARVTANARPDGAEVSTTELVYGDLVIDGRARVVSMHGTELLLTPKMFDLLLFLASHPRQAFSRAELLARVWGPRAGRVGMGTVTEHVRRLRNELYAVGAPTCIRTVRSNGYRFDPPLSLAQAS
jgi:two-component system phosphate regulon response regulator PhoB